MAGSAGEWLVAQSALWGTPVGAAQRRDGTERDRQPLSATLLPSAGGCFLPAISDFAGK